MAPGRESVELTMKTRICSCTGVLRIATIVIGIVVIIVEAASFGYKSGPNDVKKYARAVDVYFLVVTSLCFVLSIVALVISILAEMKDCMKISDLIYSLTAAVALFAAAVMLFSLVSSIRSGPETYGKVSNNNGNSTNGTETDTTTTTQKSTLANPNEKAKADRKNIAAVCIIIIIISPLNCLNANCSFHN